MKSLDKADIHQTREKQQDAIQFKRLIHSSGSDCHMYSARPIAVITGVIRIYSGRGWLLVISSNT